MNATIALLLVLCSAPAFAMDLRSTAKWLNVHDAQGRVVCQIPRGTPVTAQSRDPGATEVLAQVDVAGCPKEGWLGTNYLRDLGSMGEGKSRAVVELNGLSLRSSPGIKNNYLCWLDENTKLIVDEGAEVKDDTATWLKVRLETKQKNCPMEGYVSAVYVKPDLNFDKLPVVTPEERMPRETTHADSCTNCDEVAKSGQYPMPTPRPPPGLSAGATRVPRGQNPYMQDIRKMIKDRKACERKEIKADCNRGLIQMPLLGSRGNIGACGSHHYRPDRPIGIDAFANPETACVLMALKQKWKKEVCPNRRGCTIQWGNISHRNKVNFPPHATHKHGDCIDIRPMRKGRFEDSRLTWTNQNYDLELTKKLITTIRQMGGSQILFSDPKAGATVPRNQRSRAAHNDHIHVCFNNKPRMKKTCDDFEIDTNICPEVK